MIFDITFIKCIITIINDNLKYQRNICKMVIGDVYIKVWYLNFPKPKVFMLFFCRFLCVYLCFSVLNVSCCLYSVVNLTQYTAEQEISMSRLSRVLLKDIALSTRHTTPSYLFDFLMLHCVFFLDFTLEITLRSLPYISVIPITFH